MLKGALNPLTPVTALNNLFVKRKGECMDFQEKARIRLSHWINHSEEHLKEYEAFSMELENAGKNGSAGFIREMAQLTAKSTDCLRKALEALNENKDA